MKDLRKTNISTDITKELLKQVSSDTEIENFRESKVCIVSIFTDF